MRIREFIFNQFQKEVIDLDISKLISYPSNRMNFFDFDDVLENQIIHTNSPELIIENYYGKIYVFLDIELKDAICRFRVTTNDPSCDIHDIVLYPGVNRVRLSIDNESYHTLCVDFNFLKKGQFRINNIKFFKYKYFSLPNCLPTPNFVEKYNEKFDLDDVFYLNCPEPHSHERFIHIFPHINIDDNITTLDIGAGGAPMFSDYLISKSNMQVDLLVYGEDDCRRANRLIEMNNISSNYSVVEGDILDSNDGAKKYDQILLLDVLEHIEDHVLCLSNIAKMMSDESKLIISVPNNNYSNIFGDEFNDYVGHVRDGYSKEQILNVLQSSGFKINEMKYYGGNNNDFYENYYKKNKIWNENIRFHQENFELVRDNMNLKEVYDSANAISLLAICSLSDA
ncbi:class I SAM-dependent methyltransferase [Vibrio sp. WJH972]